MKFSSAVQGFFLSKQLTFSPHTVKNYGLVFRYVMEFLGDVEITAITSDDIRRFLDHLGKKRKLSKRSVHDAWIPLSSLWTWAEKELGIAHIIRGKIPQPKFTKKKIEPFTQDEVKRIVAGVEYTGGWTTKNGKHAKTKRPTALRDRALILVLVDCGIRVSEICALTIGDYDDKRGRLRIQHGKGDKERYVIVGSTARKALWKYLASREGAMPGAPLFATKTDQHMVRDNLRHTLDIIGKNAGVNGVHAHKFRHTFAVNFLRNGGNVMLLKELLGHESLVMVSQYVKIAEQDIESATKHSTADKWKL